MAEAFHHENDAPTPGKPEKKEGYEELSKRVLANRLAFKTREAQVVKDPSKRVENLANQIKDYEGLDFGRNKTRLLYEDILRALSEYDMDHGTDFKLKYAEKAKKAETPLSDVMPDPYGNLLTQDLLTDDKLETADLGGLDERVDEFEYFMADEVIQLHAIAEAHRFMAQQLESHDYANTQNYDTYVNVWLGKGLDALTKRKKALDQKTGLVFGGEADLKEMYRSILEFRKNWLQNNTLLPPADWAKEIANSFAGRYGSDKEQLKNFYIQQNWDPGRYPKLNANG